MFNKKIYVKKDERALLFRRGDFDTILGAGEHKFFDPLRRITFEVFPQSKPEFNHRLADFIVKDQPELVAREFHVIALGAQEAGLRYENGVLVELLAPNTRRVYFKGFVDLKFEVIDVAENIELTPALTREIFGTRNKVAGADGIFAALVPQHHVAMLMWMAKSRSCWSRVSPRSSGLAARFARRPSICGCKPSKWRVRKF
jgi:hypothetical protein